jgi:sec-independent protein translocase protein TatA
MHKMGRRPQKYGSRRLPFGKSFDCVFGREIKEHSMFEGLFQPMHLLVIFGIALLVFGPKKLPELGKGIGEGIRGFKSAIKAEEEKPANTTTIIANDQAITKG